MSVILIVVYAVAIAAFRIGRLELRQSIAFFALKRVLVLMGRVLDIMHLAGSDGPPTAIHALSSPVEKGPSIKPEEKIVGTSSK